MEYIYSLYDPQTNKLLYCGTPEQLVERGLYKRKGAVSSAYRVQVEGARPKKWRIERERKYPEERAARQAGETGMVKRCCTKDCPERRPACSDYCERYKAWKKELAKERLHTRNETYAGSIHKNDFDEEFWIGKRRR